MTPMRWLFSGGLFAGGLALLISLSACQQRAPELPAPSSEAYRKTAAAFYTGVAGIQTNADYRAEAALRRATKWAPGEPAGWANLSVLAMRQNRFDEAEAWIEKARALAPQNSQVHFLSGVLARTQGRTQQAVSYFQQALTHDPQNLKAAYALMQELERQDPAGNEEQIQHVLDEMLKQQPENLFLLLERARLAAKQRRTDTLQAVVARVGEQAEGWPDEVQQPLQALQASTASSDFRQAATQIAFLKNALKRLPAYRENMAALMTSAGQEGELITHFLRLPAPSPEQAPPDSGLHFTADTLSIAGGPWQWIHALSLTGENTLTTVVASSQQVTLQTGATMPFPGGRSSTPPTPHGINSLDYNNDFQTDLALAGAGGLRLFRQEAPDQFVDRTAAMQLPAAITEAAYTGVWDADLDADGDLDLVLAATNGPARVLRNNGDGTFAPLSLFEGIADLRGFAWADLDADGNPDATLLDAAGQLHVFSNQRSNAFEPVPSPAGTALAITAANIDRDAVMDLLVLRTDGSVQRLSLRADHQDWDTATLARWPALPGTQAPGTARLFSADLDNNGGFDLLAATPTDARVWLSSADGDFQRLAATPPGRVLSVADLSGGGQLDLLGLSEDGQPLRMATQGPQAYQSKSIQLRAARSLGDQRINSFGIGGTVEIRSGLLYQKQRITAPTVHFGLGLRDSVDVARIVWPNGTVQAEFDLTNDQATLAQQRLKGSCPWVFTYNGEEMQFVTDFIWRTSLGMRINKQGPTDVIHSVDWVKIEGDQLAPRDGFYDVRITAELWETHFFDHVALMAVDHPATSEVFVDERFALPPPKPAVHATTPLQPVAGAWDDQGRDVSDLVRVRDGRYLGTFELGAYQGIAEDHYVEIDLGETLPQRDSLWLVASGWIWPTDSSINFAIKQGAQVQPRGLSLEVPDGQGGWRVVNPDLGFPSGRTKTILIDLSDVFRPGTPHRVRLRTNLEIYWDRLAWATNPPEAASVKTHRLQADAARLRHRGFSVTHKANRASPGLPDYNELAGTTPRWFDLTGYYTRYGDVRPLVTSSDDRYVIMNAGDELVFQFPALPPPPQGWTRDFVLIGDGWVKDGDYNTGFSKTVRPLPYHGLSDYAQPPVPLEDDPAYQRHPEDWQTYHTRYVTPAPFQEALTLQPDP